MHVSKEDVKRIASLSMLWFDESAEERIQQDLESILAHVQRLSELDTSNVPPTSYILEQQNILRSDRPGPMWSREEMLANAPECESGCFAVPKVVD